MPFDQDQFRAIISGRRRDAWARVARSLLGVAALGYRLAVGVRSALYDHHVLRSHRADAVVLCIGNLTTGGTGKTPLVIWLARLLREKGLRVAVLTRGYKARETVGNAHSTDEPAELASACPGAPVIVNPDRVAGATEAIRGYKAQVLLMDDGFQHRRLARDLDIVAVDATVPFGYGRLLPAGLLREPISGLKRAHAVVLTRCDLAERRGERSFAPTLDEIEAQIRGIKPDMVIARSVHAPVSLHYADGSHHDPDELRGKKVFAFCGLGNPVSFLRTVEACGCELIGSQTFNDHHAYTDRDLADIHARLGRRAPTCC